jgi:hypothetical protein
MVVFPRPRNMCVELILWPSNNSPVCCKNVYQSLHPFWLQQSGLTDIITISRWPYRRQLQPHKSQSVNTDMARITRKELPQMGVITVLHSRLICTVMGDVEFSFVNHRSRRNVSLPRGSEAYRKARAIEV